MDDGWAQRLERYLGYFTRRCVICSRNRPLRPHLARSQPDCPLHLLAFKSPYLPFKQGGTAEIIVKPANGVTLSGILVDQPLHFFPMGDGRMVALQGVYVELNPGVYPLELDAALADGTKQSFEQMVLVSIGDQPTSIQPVPPDDPNMLQSEDKQVASIVSTVTPTKDWQGKFTLPVGPPPHITDWFGTPRTFTFNGSVYHYFHGGVDYCPCSPDHPLDIYAAAPGKVVFAGKLLPDPNPPRGNATIIDDGWGVYTLYAHQKEIDVTVGEQDSSWPDNWPDRRDRTCHGAASSLRNVG